MSKKPKKNAILPLLTPSFDRVKMTSLEMMEDRGYIVEDTEWEIAKDSKILHEVVLKRNVIAKKPGKKKAAKNKEITQTVAPEIKYDEISYNPLYVKYQPKEPSPIRPTVVVVFILPSSEKEGVDENNLRKRALLEVANGSVDRLIAIYFPSSSKKRIASEVGIDVEEFDFQDLEINPYRTSYTDVHTILTKTERDAFCLENGISCSEMRGISHEDIIVRYLGARVRDVIRIDYESVITYALTISSMWLEVRPVPILYTAMEREQGDDSDDEDGIPDAEDGMIQPETDDIVVA
jgi:DNA-directed RNA polymerase subunit H (RpoH/RPB5)